MGADGYDREKNGRFATGHKGGPGRPARPVDERMLRELGEAVNTNGTLAAIIKKVIEKAKKGDPWACDFIFDRLVGKPTQRNENSYPQLDEMRRLLWGDSHGQDAQQTAGPQPGE